MPHQNATILFTFQSIYHPVHGPLVITLSIFGVFCHSLLLRIFSRKQLFSPINLLLMSLSGTQCVLLITYMLVIIYKKINHVCSMMWSQSYMATTIFLCLVNINLVFHTLGRQSWFNFKKCLIFLICLYISVPALCTPFYLNSTVAQTSDVTCSMVNVSVYYVTWRSIELMNFNFWMFGIFAKLIPCTILIVISFLLSRKMNQLENKAHVLRKSISTVSKHGIKDRSGAVRNYSRTTKLILLVLILFVLIELPQGVLNLLAGLKGHHFRQQILDPLADVLEMLTVLYSSINFVLFALMSSQVRSILKDVLASHCCINTMLATASSPPTPSRYSTVTNATVTTHHLYRCDARSIGELMPLVNSSKIQTAIELNLPATATATAESSEKVTSV